VQWYAAVQREVYASASNSPGNLQRKGIQKIIEPNASEQSQRPKTCPFCAYNKDYSTKKGLGYFPRPLLHVSKSHPRRGSGDPTPHPPLSEPHSFFRIFEGVLQASQRFGLDLTNPLPSQSELSPDFLERVGSGIS
jgi:hypothetical protein